MLPRRDIGWAGSSVLVSGIKQIDRRQGRHLLKNRRIFYPRILQLYESAQYAIRSKNLLKLNM